jgi:catechol 2,3-dioxygenase-like lactoylglutathione lyase family enzyme
MLNDAKAFSSFSVDDLGAAQTFYGETLGLDVEERPEGLALHLAGGTDVFIYQSEDYVAPKHTVLNFLVPDVDAAVDQLAQRGVRVEHYDLPDIKTDDRGVFRSDSSVGPKAIAWFKDPADHVLSVLQSS